ncbi:MAG: hypothetical protein ACYC9O_08435 [Candidatus Latescibacterota bacterium]
MPRKTIIVPVDGASNIKLEVYDFDTLECLHSSSAATPVRVIDGLDYNAAGEECAWFDTVIRGLPPELRNAAILSPVARGASGGLIGRDNTLTEVPGADVALAYTHRYPERVEERFRERAGSPEEFFRNTGSILHLPGSLTLLKRFLFEEMERPRVLDRSAIFAAQGLIISGHFLGNDHYAAWSSAGNEHSTWMCHTGARDIRRKPGRPSAAAERIASFLYLVPRNSSVAYRPIGVMPKEQASGLGLPRGMRITPGGHDTCFSHIPVMAAFARAFPGAAGKPVVQVEAGSWTMVARIGGSAELPPDGWRRDIVVQGTVDGEPVATARYGGGYDFRHVRELVECRGGSFLPGGDKKYLESIAGAADCFLLPNINPSNHGAGPFPEVRGRIIAEERFYNEPGAAYTVTNLATAITAAVQVEMVSPERDTPLVITAGGARDPLYGRMLASFTGRAVYALIDRNGSPVTETTALGAAMVGKAARLGMHPYEVDTGALGITFRPVEPFEGTTATALEAYRGKWMEKVKSER